MIKEKWLVVCRQNVGRSQMAEGFLRTFTNPDEVEIVSAGFDIEGMVKKYNSRPHPQVIEVMNEVKIDISQQEITQITLDMLERATRIIVLEREVNRPTILDDFEDKVEKIEIQDPAPGKHDGIPELEVEKLRNIRDQIKRAALQLVATKDT